MNQNKSQFWKGKGFYLALALVVAGAALASFLAIDSMMTRLQTDSGQNARIDGEETIPWDEQNTPAETKQDDVPVNSESSKESAQPAVSSSGGSSASSQPPQPASAAAQAESTAQPAPQTPSYVSPLNGQPLQAFSGDNLVYNQTLEDWRTHNGLDLAAGQNEQVKSPMAATVTKAEDEDALWGGVVELQAADGTLVRLCGLSRVYVKEGEQIEQGKAVGLLGQVPCEAELERHLHVECLQDGAYVDPAALLGIDVSSMAASAGQAQATAAPAASDALSAPVQSEAAAPAAGESTDQPQA